MKKYKIGYTTGVFDLFHIGHLNILKKAKEQCEYLIVGVSTDEVTYSYKHQFPIIPYEDRKSIIESIKYVDKVVPQENMNKLDAYKKLNFDVVFHGDDWKGSILYKDYEENLKKHGVDIVYFPYTKNISSKELIRKIRAINNEQK